MTKDYDVMTQSSSCAGTGLLEFRAVESGRVSHLRTDRDKARRIERATATLGGGRLPTLLFDCIQRVYASTPHGAMYKRPWLLQRQRLHHRRSVGEDISAAS